MVRFIVVQTVLLAFMGAVGLFLWRRQRVLFEEADEGPEEGLARELWRQGSTPATGSFQNPLIPVFGFDLYPMEMRALYDRTRALDVELWKVLSLAPEDAACKCRVAKLQGVTRGVRKDLILRLMAQPDNPDLGSLEEWGERLGDAEAQLRALEEELRTLERGALRR